jgi:soluble lytic murein transglycosylase-like protein
MPIESANQKRYGFGIEKAEALHDPATNLAYGVKILNAWVKADGVIATYGNAPARGGGRYWSTLREREKHLPEITKFTQSLAVCSGA